MNAWFCFVTFSFYIPSQDIGLGKRLRNDLFYVEMGPKTTTPWRSMRDVVSFQRVSVMRFNSVLIVDSFCSTDEDPDL